VKAQIQTRTCRSLHTGGSGYRCWSQMRMTRLHRLKLRQPRFLGVRSDKVPRESFASEVMT
jgi:hypothetical protein